MTRKELVAFGKAWRLMNVQEEALFAHRFLHGESKAEALEYMAHWNFVNSDLSLKAQRAEMDRLERSVLAKFAKLR